MKNILVLLFVLACAGWASADLIVNYDATTIWVDVDVFVNGYELVVEVTDGDLQLDGSAVTFGFIWEYDNNVTIDTPSLFRAGASNFFGLPQGPGTLVGGLAYTGAGTLLVTDLYNPDFDPVSVTIPEPMSMVLLGLGGLFLRRRK